MSGAAGAFAQVIYVNGTTGSDSNSGGSWGQAYRTLTAALSAATNGREIWVAKGTYSPGATTASTFTLKSGVKIYGGFSGSETQLSQRDMGKLHSDNATVLDGGNINYHVVFNNGSLSNTTLLDGFTITGGRAAAGGSITVNTAGAGIYNGSTGAATFSNLQIRNNSAFAGGGIYNLGPATFDNIVFSENTATGNGGAVYNGAASATFSRLTFTQNVAAGNGGGVYHSSGGSFSSLTFTDNRANAGGGLYSQAGGFTLTDGSFLGNSAATTGGGMYLAGSATTLDRISLIGNTSVSHGGGIYTTGAINLSNAVVSRNRVTGTNAAFGGGIYFYTNTHKVANVTFSNNSTAYVHATTTTGGAFYRNAGTTNVYNSIMWGNTRGGGVSDQIGNSGATGVNVVRGIVQGGYSGAMDLDPKFIDAASDDLRLSSGSPAIDAGDVAVLDADDLDAAKGTRVVNNIVDLGGYENPAGPEIRIQNGLSATLVRGQPVNTTLAAIGGSGSYSWSVVSGQLPSGLSLSPGGLISGSPFDIGSYSVVIKVSDGSNVGYRWFSGIISDGPAILYVRAASVGLNTGSSWSNALTRLQDALSLARAGDEIWVAGGTYSPGAATGDRFMLVPGVKIYGGFAGTEAAVSDRNISLVHTANASVLDGNNVNYHVVYNASAMTNSTVLDGFIVTRGNAAGGASVNGYGGGIFNSAGSPVLRNLLVTANQAYSGAGMYNSGTAVLDKVVFRANTASSNGGGFWSTGTATLTDVLFADNNAISRGGGMLNSSSSIFNRVSFINNSSGYHGGAFNNESGSPKLDNVVFSRNKITGPSGYGAGFYNTNGSPVITNATFSKNATSFVHATTVSGGGAYSGSGTLTIRNSIIWGNARGGNVSDQLGASVVVSSSIVEGGHTGDQLMLGDPLFMDADADDLRLKGGSPAIDAGDNSKTLTIKDIAGNDRVVNSNVDLGAYEIAVNNGLVVTTNDFGPLPRGVAYQTDLQATGGTGSYTWSVGAGELPPGMQLSTAGRISGVPMQAGSFDFVASVTDGNLVGSRQYTVIISAAPMRIYVRMGAVGSNAGISWADAMTDLQSALAIASAGDEIWVAKGTYSPGAAAASTFSLRADVKLYGGFSGTESDLTERDPGKLHTDNETVLTGNDVNEHVVTASGTLTNGTVLDGFSITRGKTTQYGGGVYISSNTVAAVFKNLIIKNNAAHRGGGVYNIGTAAFTDVQITDNSATENGGGLYTTGSMDAMRVLIARNTTANNGGGIYNTGNATFTETTVSQNRSTAGSGGGMYSIGSPQIANVGFEQNISGAQGGGLAISGGNAVLTNVRFIGNTSVQHGGGLFSAPATGSLTNIVFSGNQVTGTGTSSYGGGMYHSSGATVITNATFSRNSTANSTASGAGLYVRNSGSVGVYNSILWDNLRSGGVSDEVTPSPAGNLTISHSVVAGGYSNGTDILIGDPLFENAAAHDLRLKGGSAAIDNGNNARNNSSFDVVGGQRIYNGTIDLGAYENQGSPSISVDPHVFQVATRGTALSEQLNATGGTGNYTWTVTSGALPDGLVLTASGELRGVPLTSGNFDFAVSVTDGAISGGRQFSLQVNPGAVRFHVTQVSAGARSGVDWPNALTSISEALQQALSGDEIWVAKGVYSPGNTPISSFTLKEGVKVYGGFAGNETLLAQRNMAALATANETILSGGDINHHVVFNNISLTNATLLDGFTVTEGKAQTCCSPNINYYGGGIYNGAAVAAVFRNLNVKDNSGYSGAGIYNLGAAVFENIILTDNIASTDGGAMYNTGAATLINVSFVRNSSGRNGGGLWNSGTGNQSQLTFIDNAAAQSGGGVYNTSTAGLSNGLFRNNRAYNGAGLYSTGAVTMSDIAFEDNIAQVNGGGIWTSAGLNITRTQFKSNQAFGSGGALYNGGASVLDRVSFISNISVGHGGAVYNTGTATRITNSIFSRNRVTSTLGNFGAGIYNFSGTLTTSNNTFSQNAIAYVTAAAGSTGAAVHLRSGTVNAYNSIFWGNTRGGSIPDQINGGISLVNAVVQGGYPGGFEVMIGDPLFANAAGDDLKLTPGSSAVDRGDDSKNITTFDFAGNTRVVNAVVDIGAHEYAGGGMLSIGPGSVLPLTRGTEPTVTFSATGGNGSYTWSVTSGSLPPGLFLTAAGALQGIPMVQGSYTFVISASDGTATGSRQYTLIVNPGSARLHVDASATGQGNGGSWNNAFTDLQAAIAVSVAGDEIWVARGTYSPGPLYSSTFSLKEGVKWYGGFAGTENSLAQRDTSKIRTDHRTILDGSQGTPSYHVVSNSAPLTSATVLDGFIIKGGRSLVDAGDYVLPAYVGAGLYNDNAASALHVANVDFENNRATNGAAIFNSGPASFSNVHIRVNTADYRGGGIYNTGTATFNDMVITGNTARLGGGVYSTGAGTLKNSTVFGNNAFASGGGVYTTKDAFSMIDVSVSSNTASNHGGGLYSENGDHSFDGVNFAGNSATASGGAVYVYSGGPEFSGVRFSGNSSLQHGGAFYNQTGYVQIYNSLFTRNRVSLAGAFFGGGLYSYGGSVFLTNTTFSLNRIGYVASGSSSYGGAVFRNGGTLTANNSIFWKNERGAGVADQVNSGLAIANSVVEGGYAGGTAIFDADPGFEDPATDKFDLLQGSVAVDAGDNAKNPKSVDLNGQQRVFGNSIDLGAFEKQTAEPVEITPATVGPIVRGATINIPLAASGGTAPYLWSVLAGQLPPGMELTSNGQLKGVATLNGEYEVFIAVTDHSVRGTRRFVITVTPGPARFFVDRQAVGGNSGTDWANAFTDLQTALSKAVAGDEIWVAKGVYSPGPLATSTFTLKEGVKIYGGFAGTEDDLTDRDHTVNVTTLSGADGVASYHVVYNASPLSNQTVLDGFTISGGRTVINGTNSVTPNYVGAGLFNGHASGSPVLSNLIFTGNRATNGGAFYSIGKPAVTNVSFLGNIAAFQGGAIYNTGDALFDGLVVENNSAQTGGGIYNSGAVTLTNSQVRNNRANNSGGAVYTTNSPFTVSKTDFVNNAAETQHGGAILVNSGVQLFNEVTFRDNTAEGSGGAVYLRTGSMAGDRLTVVNNTAKQHGGAFYNMTNAAVTNSVFNRNSVANSGSYYGGAIHQASGTLTVTNATFFRNSIGYTNSGVNSYGGAVSRSGGSVNIYNSIFWDNSRGNGTSDQIGPGGAVKNSVVQGGYQGGTLILTTDPLFADVSAGNLSLTACSPAINMGDNSYNMTAGDHSGASRVAAGIVDMGAFENQSLRLTLSPATVPNAKRGLSYSQQLAATGGNGNYSFSVTYGQIPDGLVLDASGLLNGTPFVSGTYTFNVTVTDGSFCGNQLYVMEVEEGSGGVRIYVSEGASAGRNNGSNWSDAYVDLQKALSVAVAGDEIWVSKGSYSPGNLGTSWFTLKEGVKLFGGFAGTETLVSERDPANYSLTILDGSQGVASYHVLYNIQPITNATVVDGFKISGGKRPAANGMSAVHYYGAGFYNSGGSPILRNLVFENNHTKMGGGLYNSGGSPALENVVFQENTAAETGGALYSTGLNTVVSITTSGFVNNSSAGNGGAINVASGSVTVADSYFAGNKVTSNANGGAIYSASPINITGSSFDSNDAYHGGAVYTVGVPTIREVTFKNNRSGGYGGAAYFGGAATLARVSFSNNTAGMHGGAVYLAAGGKISNSVFSRNKITSSNSYYGGAVYHSGGSLEVVNSSFSANQIALVNPNPSTMHGAALASRTNTSKVTNSILWGNTRGNSVADQLSPGVVVANSLVENGYVSGTQILVRDPLFTNPAADDLSLQSCSPAINMGDNVASAALVEDFTGGSRLLDGTVDLGAYENGSTRLSITTVSLSSGVRGDSYSQALTTTGGTGVYTYSMVFGALPDGLSLSPTGVISGKPFVSGSFTFSVMVSDGTLCGSKRFTMTVAPGTGGVRIYVNQAAGAGANNGSDWSNGYLTLQQGLSVSRPADEIWVAKGTYSPGNTPTSWFTLQEGVKIYGGFEGSEDDLSDRDEALLHTDNKTVLGSTTGTVGYHVIYNTAPLTNATVLDGFTIQGGKAAVSGSYTLTPNYIGGGIYNANAGSRPVLSNLIITGNTAINGGGMYNTGSPEMNNIQFVGNSVTFGYGGGMFNTGSPVMTDVDFNGNSSGSRGGALYNSGSPVLTGSDFVNNTSIGNGGAVYTEGGSLALSQGSFRSNRVTSTYSGGAVYATSAASTAVTGVSFIDNSSANSGGAFYTAGSSVLKNVVFSRNRVTSAGPYYGGGLYMTNGSVTLVNATFSLNSIAYVGTGSSVSYGGGFARGSGTADISNSIFWGNTRGGGVLDQINSGIAVASSIIEGGYLTGTMISAADPRFTNPSADDLSLQSCSPAIDAGDAAKLGGVTVDLTGQPRVAGTFPDLGAIEYQGVGPGTAPEILPNALQWTPYSQKLSSASPGYTYSLSFGALPDGMTLAPDGTLSGKPSTAGVHTFGLSYTNGSQCGNVKVEITVDARAPYITAVIAPYPDPVIAHLGKTFADVGLVSEVDVMLSDGSQTKVTVQWAPGAFDGNVVGDYPVQGTLQVAPEINPDGKVVEALISVINPMTKFIVSVDALPPVYVLSGTAFDDLNLPSTVKVTYNDNTTEVLGIKWKPETYGTTPLRYQMIGDLVLTDEYSNPTNKVANIDVYARLNIISVDALSDIYVALNTPVSGLSLPSMARVTYHDQTTGMVLVYWDTTPYVSNLGGTYVLEGNLDLNVTTSNNDGIKANVRVIVRKNITWVDNPVPLSVPYGTPFADIGAPDSVSVKYNDGTTGMLAVIWSPAGYNGMLEGDYNLLGAVELPDGITNSAGINATVKVTVLQRPKAIQSYAAVAPRSVPFGTAVSDILPALPGSVQVTYDNGDTEMLTVTWGAGDYDGGVAGSYSLSGEFMLPAGVINPDNITASVTVSVERQFITGVTLVAATVPYGTPFNDLVFPPDIAVTYNNGASGREDVGWLHLGTYDPTVPGDYTFYGTILTRPEVDNPNGYQGQITFRVLAAPPNIVSVTVSDPVAVAYGTAAADLRTVHLPSQVNVNLDNGSSRLVDVTWDLTPYSPTVPSAYTLQGGLLLPSDITNTDDHAGSVVVTVDSRYIVSTTPGNPVSVAYGTTFADLQLPLTVDVAYSDGTTGQLPVIWDPTGYNNSIAASYLLSGAFELPLPPGTDNRQGVVPTVTVEVQAQTFDLLSVLPESVVVDYGTVFGSVPKPASVNGTLDDGSSVVLTVSSWDPSGYQQSVPGSYRVTGLLTLPANVTNPNSLVAELDIIVDVKHITSATPPAPQTVDFNTLFNQLTLPTTVQVTYNDLSTGSASVQWQPGVYDPSIPGTYELTGILTVTEPNTSNKLNVTATMSVVVQPRMRILIGVQPSTINVGFGTPFSSLGLPASMTGDFDDTSQSQIGTTWTQGAYNSSVAGTYTLSANMVLPADAINPNGVPAEVTVVVGRRFVQSVGASAPVSAPYHTVFGALNLPGQVSVTYNDGSSGSVPVLWNQGGYNWEPGTYTLSGNLQLDPDTDNPNGLQPTVVVTVLPEDTEIITVEVQSGVTVPYGTLASELGDYLPIDVGVTYNTGGSGRAGVTWTSATYDRLTPGSYTFTGVLQPASGAANAAGHTSTITVVVARPVLTIAAEHKIRYQGDANPPLTFTINGFVNGDDETVLSVQPTISTVAVAGSAVGHYEIAVAGAVSAAYDINYVSGDLEVVPVRPAPLQSSGPLSVLQIANYMVLVGEITQAERDGTMSIAFLNSRSHLVDKTVPYAVSDWYGYGPPGTLPLLVTGGVRNIVSSGADAGGFILSDGGAPVTERGVCWSTSPGATIGDSKLVIGTGPGGFAGSITGLLPNTTYYIRAFATNSKGTAYGNEIIFKTSR